MPGDWRVSPRKSGEVAQPEKKGSRSQDYSAYQHAQLRLDLMQVIKGPTIREASEIPTDVRDEVIHSQGNHSRGAKLLPLLIAEPSL